MGLPCAWQGWVVLIGYFALIGASRWLIAPDWRPAGRLAFVIALTGLLIAIGYAKGEPQER
jgi:hypothetical protein